MDMDIDEENNEELIREVKTQEESRDLINKKYKIIKKIGNGSFGNIYKGMNILTTQYVAIKMENKENDFDTLKNETKMLMHLSEYHFIPKVKYFGIENNKNILVMDLLSINLYQLLLLNNNDDATSNYEKIIKYGIQMIEIIKCVHSKGILHRDIKPENFMISKYNEENLYLIDFGLSRFYLKNNKHIENNHKQNMVGTVRYASTFIHEGNTYSRRDDIISIIYVIIYLLKGKLPWQGITSKIKNIEGKNEMIYKIKKNTNYAKLCEGLKNYLEFEILLSRILNLSYYQIPDYDFIIKTLKSLIN